MQDNGSGPKPWLNLVFNIASHEARKSDVNKGRPDLFTLTAMCEIEGQLAGFGFEIFAEDWWKPNQPSMPTAFGRMAIFSLGEVTDRLIAAMENYFNFAHTGYYAKKRLECTAVNNGGETSLGAMAMKLFFDVSESLAMTLPDCDMLNAECFISWELGANIVYLKEKDLRYRKALLGWLTGKIDINGPVK